MTLLTSGAYVLPLGNTSTQGTQKPEVVILTGQFVLISEAMKFMNLVLNSSMTGLMPPKAGRAGSEISALGKMLVYLERFSQLYASGHSFHPYLRFYFDEYRKHPIKDHADRLHGDVTAYGKATSEVFDNFISTLRTRAVDVNLRKKAADWESKYRKNAKRLRKVEAEMFRGYARVLAVRLDFHHKASFFTEQELTKHMAEQQERQKNDRAAYLDGIDLDNSEPITGRVPFETVQRHRKRLFDNMKGKPSLFKHLVAFVWRIEFTPGAGYHLHVALFFDGSKAQKHKWLAQEIGVYWRDRITAGEGWFHNCNMDWNEKSPGYALGVINHYDSAKRAALMNALDYLCKRNQQVVVLPYKGCNLFRACLVHPGKEHGRGRPRVKVATAQNARQWP